MTNSTMTLKLLINKQARKIVFAEANKDFVDFLFYILTLPIGGITKLFAKEPLSGSLGDLYQSIDNLNDMYMLQNKSKDTVLNPKSSTNIPNQDLLLIPNDQPNVDRKYYRCASKCRYVMDDLSAGRCPNCGRGMIEEVIYVSKVAAKAEDGECGFVKGVVTYMVMDDLQVKPMSTISTITLLNKLSVKDISVLEEKEVKFGMEEGLKLLKASLDCKNVLTRVFLDSEDHVQIK